MNTTTEAPPPAEPSVGTAVVPVAKSVLPGWVLTWEHFIKTHEKLVVIGVLAVLSFHFYSKGIDAWDRHDSRIAQQAATVVKVDDAQTVALKQELEQLKIQVAASNTGIRKQIVIKNDQTKQQQQIDATLTPTKLSEQISKLLKIPTAEVTPAPIPGKLEFDQNAAVIVAQQLETIPALQNEVDGLNTIITNDNTIITKQNDMIAQLNTDLVDEKKSHVADVNAEKVKARHSFIRGLKIGAVAGFVVGLYLGHKI